MEARLEMENSDVWTFGLQFLDSGNYIAVNRSLIRAIGLHEAVIVGELASEAMLWAKEGKLNEGWFYITTEKLEYKTSLSAHLQRKAMNNLSDSGIIQIAYKGIPKKRFVRIDFQQLMTLVNDKSLNPLTTVDEPRSPLEANPVNDINNQQELTNQQQPSKDAGTRAKKKRQPFKEPTLEEVTAYCQERKNSVDPQAFIAYYQTRGWELKGGAKMKDWKASVRYWERTEKKYSGGDPTDRRSQYTEQQNQEFDLYSWDAEQITYL